MSNYKFLCVVAFMCVLFGAISYIASGYGLEGTNCCDCKDQKDGGFSQTGGCPAVATCVCSGSVVITKPNYTCSGKSIFPRSCLQYLTANSRTTTYTLIDDPADPCEKNWYNYNCHGGCTTQMPGTVTGDWRSCTVN